MGMRVQGAASASQSVGMSNWQQRQQNFKDLFSSLQSGDLSSAQKALQGLTGGASSVNSKSPLASIAQALQAGDLAGAQKAAQEFQAQRTSHHHHRAEQTTPNSVPPSTANPKSGPGSLLNVSA